MRGDARPIVCVFLREDTLRVLIRSASPGHFSLGPLTHVFMDKIRKKTINTFKLKYAPYLHLYVTMYNINLSILFSCEITVIWNHESVLISRVTYLYTYYLYLGPA